MTVDLLLPAKLRLILQGGVCENTFLAIDLECRQYLNRDLDAPYNTIAYVMCDICQNIASLISDWPSVEAHKRVERIFLDPLERAISSLENPDVAQQMEATNRLIATYFRLSRELRSIKGKQ